MQPRGGPGPGPTNTLPGPQNPAARGARADEALWPRCTSRTSQGLPSQLQGKEASAGRPASGVQRCSRSTGQGAHHGQRPPSFRHVPKGPQGNCPTQRWLPPLLNVAAAEAARAVPLTNMAATSPLCREPALLGHVPEGSGL